MLSKQGFSKEIKEAIAEAISAAVAVHEDGSGAFGAEEFVPILSQSTDSLIVQWRNNLWAPDM